MNFERKIKKYGEAPLSRHLVMELLEEYKRPNDKISELIKSGELVSLRRGLYAPGPQSGMQAPENFVIANHLRGPSYVSLEAALAWWGLIPERVHEISSVTTRTSKKYNTALGRFSFQHLASPYYSFGIESVKLSDRQNALLASREKALCDLIVLSPGVLLRSKRQTQDYLLDDLRMDEEQLRSFDIRRMRTWLEDAPKKSSLQLLINTLEAL